MKRDSIIQIFKYGIFGVVTTIFNLILFYILNNIGINYILSNTISYMMAVLVSYFLNKIYVFKSEENNSSANLKQGLKFTIVRLLSLFIENLFLIILIDVIKINIYTSKISVSILIILSTFVVNKWLVFKK